MHTLIITAHPSSEGFTHQIAATYQAGRLAKGHTCEILDLYKTDDQIPYPSFEQRSDMKIPNAHRDHLQAKIAAADELVFVFPIWWVSMPAILKNFFDTVFTAGFAFQYEKGKSMPKKLLVSKTARVFTTCDANGWLYYLIGNPLWTTMVLGTFGFCGISNKSFRIFDRMHERSPDDKKIMLDKVAAFAPK